MLTPCLCPQLASAGTFRVVKEPLAFLRVLEWVSPAWGGMGRGAPAAGGSPWWWWWWRARGGVPKVSPAEQVGAGLGWGCRG